MYIQENKPTNTYLLTAAVTYWLLKNNIPFQPDIRKTGIMEKTNKHKYTEKVFTVNQIFKGNGHPVFIARAFLSPHFSSARNITLAYVTDV